MFGATLGTGVGGGLVIDGRVLGGANGSAAEWSHTTLPFLHAGERSPYECFCGNPSCIESFVSGRGLAGAYREVADDTLPPVEIGHRAESGDPAANAALDIYADRLARALAGVINLVDPRVIVLGGGVSNNARIFRMVPPMWEHYTVAKELRTTLVKAATATRAASAAPPFCGNAAYSSAEMAAAWTGGCTMGGFGLSASSSSTCTDRRL